jgi:alpha-L-fucosidase
MTTSLETNRVQWLKDARFGVFFHWGTYSVQGRNEWALALERTPLEEYERLADRFTPKPGWAEDWMDLVVASGARYAVLTAKHCEGYCLFESQSTPYNAPNTGPGRDLVREYVDASRRASIKVGLYFTPWDWRYSWDAAGPAPDSAGYSAYREAMHTQIRELCTNYGPIDLWWWDGVPPDTDEIIAWMRQAQPQMVINDRCGRVLDCASCEKEIRPPADTSRPWECCTTSNEHWGYVGAGDIRWMSAADAIHWLVCCASHGGNLLLNIGPRADGSIPARAQRLFTQIGDWLRENGEAVYGSRASSLTGGALGCTTARSDTAYLHLLHYYAPEIVILSPKVQVQSAYLLATGQPLHVRQVGERVIIAGLPRRAPHREDTVIVLKTDGSAEA